MAPAAPLETDSPSIRAALARERLDILPDNQIVYVDRLGPRILTVPPDPTVRLSRQILRELSKGNLDGRLGHGVRFSSKRMMQCPEISISTNGHYRVEKPQSNPNSKKSQSFTVKTLDVWTGKPGKVHEGRNIQDLTFYSVGAEFLPSYYSWKDDELEMRQSAVDLEIQQGAALAEQEFLESPRPMADIFDEYKEKYEAKMEVDALNDPESMLRFMPDILPSDPVWEGVEEYFKWILQLKRIEDPEAPQVYRVLQDELLESQLLLAMPAINSGYRAKIQDESTKKYHEALQTIFHGKPDNLATKLTMLCFGLPIEPLTIANAKFAGGLEDTPAKSDENVGGQIVEKILWSEKPLEFLDYFNERSYGYPMIRSQKRKYEEIDAETMEKMLVNARERAKNPSTIWEECGFPEMNELEQGLHLRGGAGDPSSSLSRTYWLYTDLGRFILNVQDSFGDFYNLLQRLLQLDARGNWAVQIDLVPIVNVETEFGVIDQSKSIRYWEWTAAKRYENQPQLYESYLTFAVEAKGLLRFRVRNNPIYPFTLFPADMCEPPLDCRNVANLEVKGVGIAYWVIPSNPQGINILQETFRNALECLIPQHRHYRVQWLIKGTESQPSLSGQLVLIAEAPSLDLWNATLEAIGSQRRLTIHLMVLDDEPMKVKILIPGFNKMGLYTRLPNNQLNQRNPHIFPTIRNLARQWTAPYRTRLRIWPGPQHYEDLENLKFRSTRSMILPAEEDLEVEENIWQSEFLALTTDAVVVTPSFDSFTIICLTNQTRDDIANERCPSEVLDTFSGVVTLSLFRDCVRRLSGEIIQENDYISIEQPKSGHKFSISPWMTEREWQTQIFDWLDNDTIMYRTHKNWPIIYSREIIEGPLGPIRSNTPSQPLGGLQAPSLLADVPGEVTPQKIKAEVSFRKGNKKIPKTVPDGGAVEEMAQEPTVEFVTETTAEPPEGLLSGPTAGPDTMADNETLTVIPPLGEKPSKSLKQSSSKPVIKSHSKSFKESLLKPLIKPSIKPPPNIISKPSKIPSGIQPTLMNEPIAKSAGRDHISGKLPTSTREGYNQYRKKQAIQEVARVEAYSRDDSIYRAGESPQIPMFGPALEGNIPVAGRTMPVVYKALSTATENLERDKELRALRKIVLDRLDYCGVCQTALPGGAHNLEERERHFQEHRNIEAEARSLGRNRNETRAHTSDEGKACPFEDCNQILNGITKDEMILHLREHIGWDDDDICPIPGCGMQLSGLLAVQVVTHLMEHVIDENTNNFRCPFAACRSALDGLTERQRMAHLNAHIGPRRGHNSHECPFEDCPVNLRALSNQKRFEHFSIHMVNNGEVPPWASPQCPFEGCDQQFTDSSRAQITHHLQTRHLDEYLRDTQATRCPLCIYNWDGVDEEVFRNHFHFNHHPDNPAEFICPYCRHRVTNDERSVLRHYQNHVSDIFCPWEGCDHQYDFESTSDDRKKHLLTHVRRSSGSGADEDLPSNLECQWPDCLHEFEEDRTSDDIIDHLRTHMPLICPISSCEYVFSPSATDSQKRAHASTHISMRCPVPACNYVFKGADTDQEKSEHVRTHLQPSATATQPIGDQQCPWPGCDREFDEDTIPGQVAAYFRSHLPIQCPYEDCFQQWEEGTPPNEISAHIRGHAPQTCLFADCGYTFSSVSTEEEKITHLRTHFPPSGDCQWPGCEHLWVEQPDDGERMAHLIEHARAHDFQTVIQAPGIQVPDSSSQSDSDGDSAGGDLRSENQDDIPQRLKYLHPGEDFYCPVCYYKVSGGNTSACRRHRGDPCNVLGHDIWLIGTDADRKQWKAAAAIQDAQDGGNAGNDDNAAPKTANPRKKTSKKAAAKAGGGSGSGSGDPNYRPPSDEEPGGGGSDAGAPVRGRPRRSGRKRQRHPEVKGGGGEQGENVAVSEVQEAKPPKKKRKT